MMVGAETAERAWRHADDPGGLLVPDAFAIGPRSDVDRIFEHAGHRAVIFWGYEQHRIFVPQAVAKCRPGGVRGRSFQILIVMREFPDLDDLELQGCRRKLNE